MKEFFVGLLVIVMMCILSVFGILLFPLFLILGIFLKMVIGLLVVIFVIWLIGKAALLSMDYLRKREEK